MTDEEKDKTEKEYKKWLVNDHKLLDNPTYCDIEQKCFRAFFAGTRYGLAEGKPKWHDSREDFPGDKRKGDEFYCKLKDENLDMEWYEVLIWDIEYQTEDIYQVPVDYMFKSLKTGKDMSDYVIAWCELPKFEE